MKNQSTVENFPIMIVMEGADQEYTGDGKIEMDKAYHESLPEYSRGNQTLTVESSFSGAMTIQQIIKQYLIEQKSIFGLDGSLKDNYNGVGNMAVVTSTKEGSE